MRSSFLTIRASVVAAAMIFVGTQAGAADLERGQILADTCKGCHAVESYTNVYPTYPVPRIGGQSEDYIVAALTLYRNGDRAHSTMMAQAGSFSDSDIKDVAAYLTQLYPTLTDPQPNGSAPDSAVACQACHGAAGVGQIPGYPVLAGQLKGYLVESLRQYKAGERKGPNGPVMQSQLLNLSDDDIKALAAYYADQEGLQVIPMD